MAWPANARYRNFVDGVTNITADFLHAVQDAIIDVVGGGKTVKRVTADGTSGAVPFTEAGGGTPYLAASFGGSGFAPMLDLHDTTAGAAQMRIYRSNAGFCAWISNAYYNIPTSKWVQEDVAKDSHGFVIDPSSSPPVSVLKKAAGSAAWTTWDAGSLNALNFVASGCLDATSGDPASGNGRVKAKQLVMSGSAPAINATTQPGADNSAGDGAGTVTGNDARMFISVTSGAATTNGKIARVTFNKAYPAGMGVTLQPTTASATDLGWTPHVSVDASGTYFDVTSGTGTKKLAAATTYGWIATVIG